MPKCQAIGNKHLTYFVPRNKCSLLNRPVCFQAIDRIQKNQAVRIYTKELQRKNNEYTLCKTKKHDARLSKTM